MSARLDALLSQYADWSGIVIALMVFASGWALTWVALDSSAIPFIVRRRQRLVKIFWTTALVVYLIIFSLCTFALGQ